MGMTIDTSLLYESGYNKGFKDGIKGSIPKADYEARLKAEKVAMLTELQSEIEETEVDVDYAQLYYCKIIQQKINSLKADQEGEE